MNIHFSNLGGWTNSCWIFFKTPNWGAADNVVVYYILILQYMYTARSFPI